MKIFYENISQIPDIKTIKEHTQQETLVLEFPRIGIDKKTEAKIISGLKENLPENYSVFTSGIWEKTK